MGGIQADTAPDGSARTELGVGDATTSCTAGHQFPRTPDEKPVSNAVPFPIAIVGMAMRLPGAVNTAEKFWEMLINKQDGHCKVPGTRYNVDAFYSSSNPGTVRSRHGYYLEDNISHIDRSFFSMSKLEAAKLDPQQRLLLEVVWECMENGGQTNWRGRNIGCFVGVFGEDWLEMSSKDVQHMDRYHVVSAGDFALSNRVSYEYDLQGPSITYRTACSSSMVGLHEACQALYTGECDSAIVAGSNLILTPTMTKSISENMVLSPSGLCRTFDAAADGYGRGEAINAVYIKPLADALRAGDPIRSIIRSTAVNCDGRTPGITTPGSEAQERLIRRAYQKAGIEDFSQTAFFECHGTGTTAGDTAETSVVAKVFGKDGIYIGAVKPNVGHSEGASGLTSIIKATLALEKRIIPPNAHFSNPNPKIPFQEARLKVPLEPTPWPEDRCERVSVNSFGIGGTNAHVIMESFSSPPTPRARMPLSATGTRVLVLSAKNGKSLQKRAEEIKKYVIQHPLHVDDLVYTLGTKREHMVHRAFATINENGEMSEFEKSRDTSSSIAFIFTGQGAQWAGMGKELMLASDRFLSSIRGLDRALSRLTNSPSWTLEDELMKPDEESRVHDTELAQPLCTAVQIALVDVLQEWGVSPTAAIGHSSGEIAAAYAAGAFSADVAITVSYFRGQALKASGGKLGGMAAVGLAAEKAKTYLLDGVTVACDNSPQSVTLSGDQEPLAKVLGNIQADEPDTFCKPLNVSVAYHSEHMKHPGWVYESLIQPFISHNSTMTPLYSTVTGGLISDPSTLDAAYWRNNLQSTVLFNGAVQTLMREAHGPRLFIEIGPHSALSSPLRQILRLQDTDQMSRYIPTLVRGQPQWRALLATAGRLFIHGAPVELSTVSSNTGKVLTDLPSYPWLHEEGFWSETRLVREWRNPREPQHELLGSRSLDSTDIEPSWRRLFDGSHVSWLWDHVIGKDMIFPCAGYIAMAGEAIRQTTGSEEYTIRNLLMKSPLLLKDSEATELVTTFRPVKLSDTADSMWYDFTITAYQNGSWTRHCAGQAKAGHDRPYVSREINPYPRLVPSTPWYEALKKRGLNFGPRFQRLENISASPSSCQAAACVQCIKDNDAVESARYALHPTVIDQSLQMLGVAMTHGISRHLTKLCMPVAIDHIFIRSGHGQMFLDTSCDTAGETITGNTIMVADHTVVLSVEKATLFAIDNTDDVDQSGSVVSRLAWKPHIDLVSLADQLSPATLRNSSAQFLEQLSSSLIVETADKIRSQCPSDPHLRMYQAWICSQADTIQRDNGHDSCLSSLCQEDHLEEAVGELGREIPQLFPVFYLARNISVLSADLAAGKVGPQDIGGLDDSSTTVYESLSASAGCGEFFSLLGHSNPKLRVLAVGIGNGFAITGALHAFTSVDGTPMYEKCTVTDRSPDRVSQGKEILASIPDIEYIVFDISQDPVQQGLEHGSYDLIITSDAFDADRSFSASLGHITTLLAPGGRLFYQELCPTILLVTYVLGIFPEWWAQKDRNEKKLLITPKQWETELRETGFADEDTIITNDPSPYSLNSTIASRPRATVTPRRDIALLYMSRITDWARSVEHRLANSGFTITRLALGQQPPPGTDVISMMDMEGPFFDNISADRFSQFQHLVTQVAPSRIIWITESSQMSCNDPRFGLVLGVARTIRHEIMPDFVTVELDRFDDAAVTSVLCVLEHLNERQGHPFLDPDYEFALDEGIIHVSRAHWSDVREQLSAARPANHDSKALDIGSYGLLSSLAWSEKPPRPLRDDEVEVDMRYVGLNFRDMMVALGVVGNKSEFGVEGSGFIRRVGSAIKHLRVGEAVIVVGDGLLRTRKVIAGNHCFPLFDGLSLADAATVACIYGTVLYSLIDIGRLQQGQSVLIHSACGGVGLAAIQVCQMLGAKIFATVGNKDKIRHLVDTFGIPQEHIFDSRSPSFLQGVMEQTGNRGVDIVLNSLSGELLHLSWRCVAKFGRMIELGKRDLLGHARLDMDLFAGNRSFTGVDAKQILEEDPSQFQKMIEQCMKCLMQGKIKPIRPVTIFDADNIEQAFWHMQTGKHMGKIVVKMPDDPSLLPVCDSSPFILPSDATILLIGGLGGLGRTVATWLVERGARSLVFFSRSAGKSPNSIAFLKELESQNCSVTAISGDVANMEDVERAILACENRLAGVIQMSMVLRDQLLSKMTHGEWLSVLAPKVQGTWNLHHSLAGRELGFFVCFSSLSGLCGNAGQANYAAANSFLDAFVRYRQGQGLAASAIDLGLMDEAGFAYEHAPKLLQRARSASVQTVDEVNLLQALELAICRPGQIASGLGTTKPLSSPGVIPPWVRDARYSLWTRIISPNETNSPVLDGDFKELIESIQLSPEILDDPITELKITRVLGREIGSHLANIDDMEESEIINMVIESLVMIEVRSWFRRHLNLELPLVEISNAGTIGGLGKVTVKALRAKYQTGDVMIEENTQGSSNSNAQYLQDAVLGKTIRPSSGTVLEWCAESEGHVFMTGATGFVGAFLLSELVALPEVQSVTCLIRAVDAKAAMNRLEMTFQKFGLLMNFRDKIRAVPGDLTQPELGLQASEFSRLAEQCSTIFHLGAIVNYTLNYWAHRDVNVLGLVHLLGFANARRLKSVHYFSGMAAYGPSGFLGGQEYVPENEPPVASSGELQHHMGYAISKFVAESIAWDAISNGFPLAIYRPGFVLGRSSTGMGNADDVVNRLMSTCINLGAYPLPPDQRNCFVPVDYVCSAALHISLLNENLGQAYNLIHPDPDQNIDLSTTFGILSELTSPPLRGVPFSDWVQLMSQAPDHRLSRIAPMLAERMTEAGIWWNSKQDAMVVYGTENVHRALSNRPELLECKTMLELVQTYFKQWSQ